MAVFYSVINIKLGAHIYTLSLHDALPISLRVKIFAEPGARLPHHRRAAQVVQFEERSEEHTSVLQSPDHLVCRLLLEKKNSQLAATLRNRLQVLHNQFLVPFGAVVYSVIN